MCLEIPDVKFNLTGNHNIKLIFKIPIKSKKKWWQFWKKDDKEAEKALIEVTDKYKEELEWNDFFLPIKNNSDKK